VIERLSFKEQLHDGKNHVNNRPGRSHNNDGKNRHLLGPLPGRFDQVFAAEIAKTAELPVIVVGRGITVPFAKSGTKVPIRLWKSLFEWAAWFHSS
jgi:hypothetical protein